MPNKIFLIILTLALLIYAFMTFSSKLPIHNLPKADTPFGLRANHPSLRDSYPELTIPPAEPDGKVATLNQQGFQTPEIDWFSDDFIANVASYAKRGLPCLDVGAAYGIVTIPALVSGGLMIANDIDPRHLLLLRNNAS